MYLTEAELESELNYFTECLAVDEEGYLCLYNESTDEYEYIEDEDVAMLAEAILEGAKWQGIKKGAHRVGAAIKNQVIVPDAEVAKLGAKKALFRKPGKGELLKNLNAKFNPFPK